MKKLILSVVMVSFLGACAIDPYTGEQKVSKTAWGTGIGAAAGAVLNLLWGITSGGLIGAQAGKLIDENVIGLYRCPKCHLRFKA